MTPTVILLLCLGSALLGVGGTLGVQVLGRDDGAEVAAATADAVSASADVAAAAAEGASSAVHEALGPEALEARARLAVAEAPAVNLAVAAAVEPGADARVLALAAYLGCMAASQAQAQGAAAYDCASRGKALDAALAE